MLPTSNYNVVCHRWSNIGEHSTKNIRIYACIIKFKALLVIMKIILWVTVCVHMYCILFVYTRGLTYHTCFYISTFGSYMGHTCGALHVTHVYCLSCAYLYVLKVDVMLYPVRFVLSIIIRIQWKIIMWTAEVKYTRNIVLLH